MALMKFLWDASFDRDFGGKKTRGLIGFRNVGKYPMKLLHATLLPGS